MSYEHQSPNRLPLASDIVKTLVDGEDPLDFIKRNLRTQEALQPSQPPAQPSQPQPQIQPQPQVEQPPLPELKTSFKDKDTGLELPYDTTVPSKPVPPAEAAPTEKVEELENKDKQEAKGPEESLKHLRKKTGELSRTVEERSVEITKLQTELERYKTGEATPDKLQELQQQIDELNYYKELHALKLSPSYTEKYIEPIEQLKNKAIQTAEDYGVDPSVLDQAYKIENKRELNQFLRRHFDDVGALEVRDLLGNIKEIDQAAQEAAAKPAETLSQLKEEQTRVAAEQEAARVERISTTAKGGWIEALTELRSAGNYPELTLTGDEENDKFVKPILNEAATEYGKFVKELGLNGTKELRPEAAKILAKRYLLSQAAAIAMESRAQHHQRAEEIAATAQRQANFIRPPVGGGVSSPISSAPKQPSSPAEAAEELLRRIGMR